jgi:hypothetical protein
VSFALQFRTRNNQQLREDAEHAEIRGFWIVVFHVCIVYRATYNEPAVHRIHEFQLPLSNPVTQADRGHYSSSVSCASHPIMAPLCDVDVMRDNNSKATC